MITLYDSYNYPQYWETRKYEDQAEKIALKRLLRLVTKKDSLIDIGGGYGRLAPVYIKEFKTCLLIDPSKNLLNQGKKKFKEATNLSFKTGRVQKLPVKNDQFDAAIMIRVSHHLHHLEKAFLEVNRVLKPKGFFIFEFANKINFKASVRAIFRRKLGFFVSHLPEDISSQKKIPFINYHPSHIKSLLLSNGFQILKTFSVSNFRHRLIKKLVPLKILLALESAYSSLSSAFSLYSGPSIFILAQKR